MPFTATSENPKEELAAYLTGRRRNGSWGSAISQTHLADEDSQTGRPVAESPRDGKDASLYQSNNFDFHPVNKYKCPFAVLIRKTRSRRDLGNDHAVIVLRGISYGDEVTPEEKAA